MQAHNSLSIDQIKSRKPSDSLLTPITLANPRIQPNGDKTTMIDCICSCGEKTTVALSHFLKGHTRSCGCYQREILRKARTKYIGNKTGIHSSYFAMISRCYDSDNRSYKNYGGRGVSVCDEWRNNYQSFLDWSLANGWSPGLEIDKDIKGNGLLYSPETCCWVTGLVNMSKTSRTVNYNYKGEDKNLPTISRITGIKLTTLAGRVRDRGLTVQEAVSKPVNKPHRTKGSSNKTTIKFAYKGTFLSARNICEAEGISWEVMRTRIRRGRLTVNELIQSICGSVIIESR